MVDSKNGYGKEEVPEISGKGGVNASEDRYKAVFISSYGALGKVRAMVAGRLELSGDVMQAKEVEERLREFVIGSYVGER